MVAFIIVFTIVACYIVMDWIISVLSIGLLRKYGRCGNGWLPSLKVIKGLRVLIKDPHTSKEDVRWARFYFGYLTWGFAAVALLIIIMWVCGCVSSFVG